MPRPFVPPTDDDDVDWDAPEEERARNFGTRYCELWLSEAYPDQVDQVTERLPGIPVEVDAPMLRAAEAEFGPLREREDLRRAVRQGFSSYFVSTVLPDTE